VTISGVCTFLMDKTTDEKVRRNDESIAKEEYQVDCNLIY